MLQYDGEDGIESRFVFLLYLWFFFCKIILIISNYN